VLGGDGKYWIAKKEIKKAGGAMLPRLVVVMISN
jgi:hypothetical protein